MMRFDVLDHHDASSTTMPITSTMPNMVSTLIEKPGQQRPKVPSSATRHHHGRDHRVAPVLQERDITRNTSTSASNRVSTTCSIEIADEARGVVRNGPRRGKNA